MGRTMTCGIATKIKVWSKVSIQENKEDILKRIGSTFNLKYYEIGNDSSDSYMCLYLKEDLFNEKFKELMKELVNINPFRRYMYNSIDAIEQKYESPKEKKERVIDYLDNHFDLKLRKEYEKKYDYKLQKEIIDKNNYAYFLDGFENNQNESNINFENYFYCTDMCDKPLFEDNLDDYFVLQIGFNYMPLYFDGAKTDSEDISFTLMLMNHLLRDALKCELKTTLFFGLTD